MGQIADPRLRQAEADDIVLIGFVLAPEMLE